jgi:hypothetical protein
MPGSFADYFEDEHQVTLVLVARCCPPGGGVDVRAFEQFRQRLLQHIAREERVVLPALEAKLGHTPRWRRLLTQDHVALVKLCVVRPDRDWVEGLSGLLEFHRGQELKAHGLIAACDALLPREVLSRALALPPVQVPTLASDGRDVPLRLDRALRATGLR